MNQEVSTVEVGPEEAALGSLGDTKQFEAEAKDANGNLVSGVTFSWISSDESVATVDGNGLATALGEGETVIRAEVSGVLGTANLTVQVEKKDLIAFWSNRGGHNDACGGFCEDIYVMGTDGSDVRQLTTDPGQDLEPAWSPNRLRIVFVKSWPLPATGIYSINTDGTGPIINLTANLPYAINPAWSPDGTKIAFLYFSKNDSATGIAVMNATDGSEIVRLTKEFCHPTGCTIPGHPTWSPDETKIAFNTPRDGNSEIYIMNADGSGQINFTNSPSSAEGHPTWSPDGSKIAFVSNRSGNRQIFVMNTDGGKITQLTDNTANDFDPVWSPDGTKIAFTTDRDGNYEVYVMNANGSEQVNLTNHLRQDRYPAWSSR